MKVKNTLAIAAVLLVGMALGAVATVMLTGEERQHKEARDDGHDDDGHDDDGHDDDGHDDDGRDDDRHDEDGHDEEGHEEGVVHLTPEQLASLDLKAVPVRMGSLKTTVDLPSEVHWNTDRLVHMTPRVEGIVERVKKTLGDTVEEGDLLCILDSREMGRAKMEYLADLGKFAVSEADFERSKAVYENTKKLLEILDKSPLPEDALSLAADISVGDNKNQLLTTYTRMRVNRLNLERTEGLLEKKIASEVDHLNAKGDYAVSRADFLSTREEIVFDLNLKFLRAERDFALAKTEVKNSEHALGILGVSEEEIAGLRSGSSGIDRSISRSDIRSTLAGVIVERHLTAGELVGTDTQLYTIADPSEVWILGRIYERDVRFLQRGQQATVRLDAFPGELFEGTIDYIGSQLDPETRSVEARVVLPNPKRRIRPGMFGGMTVFTEHEHEGPVHDEAFLVPLAALQRVGDGYVVFRALEPGEYRQVPVYVLARSKEFAEVSGDLEEGALVVTAETFILRSEIGKEQMGGGHSH